MRFRFLGDVDCPDWLLAEIYHLSQMPINKAKELAQIVVNALIEEALKEETVAKFSQDAEIDVTDVKVLIAALDMIFTSSARNSVMPADLDSELQQLGLPKEHSSAVSTLHEDNCTQISSKLTGQSLRLSKLSSIEALPSDASSPFARIALKLKTSDDKETDTTLNIAKEKVYLLLKELKGARAIMDQISH